VESGGAPYYFNRARRYRGRGGPCYKPRRSKALGENKPEPRKQRATDRSDSDP
jgi:hypothetical protein